MVAPRSLPRPSVLSSSGCIDLQLKTSSQVPSYRLTSYILSPAQNQYSTLLRTVTHLATIGLSSCVDSAISIRVRMHQLCMLLFVAVSSTVLSRCWDESHPLALTTYAILRAFESYASASALLFALALTAALFGLADTLALGAYAVPVTAAARLCRPLLAPTASCILAVVAVGVVAVVTFDNARASSTSDSNVAAL
eukprot:3191986-Pleurochrysis_carterae.AAC.1